MHEATLMQSAIEQALEAASRAGSSRITGLRLRIGAWAGVVPEALQFAFEVLTRETAAEGARLEIDPVEARCHCDLCKLEFSPRDHVRTCPDCGNRVTRICAGHELELESIEVCD